MSAFRNTETGQVFSYTDTADDGMGATHLVDTGDIGWPWRYAKVLKTVAYVAVDEDDSGIIWEKWPIAAV